MDVDRPGTSITLSPLSQSIQSLHLESQADIFVRIRALLASRNEHHYPRAPSPTPVYGRKLHALSSLPDYMSSLDQDLAGRFPRLVQQKSGRPEMVSAIFDGSKGQIADMDGLNRSLSDPRKFMSRARRSDGDLSETYGLDYRTMRDPISRDSPVIRNGIASKTLFEATSHGGEEGDAQHDKVDIPRLGKEIELSPERFERVKEHLRPSFKSAPGSYINNQETGVHMPGASTKARTIITCSCGATSRVTNKRSGALGLSSPACSLCGQNGFHSDHANGRLDPTGHIRSSSSSFSTSKSRGLHQHSLLNQPSSALDMGLPLPPILSSKIVHGESSAGSRNLEVLDSDSLATTAVENILKVTFRSDNPVERPLSIHLDSLAETKDQRRESPGMNSSEATLKEIKAGNGFGENNTASDYAASSRAADQESVISGSRPNHTALSYEQLATRPSLHEITPQVELEQPGFTKVSRVATMSFPTPRQPPIMPQVMRPLTSVDSSMQNVDLGEIRHDKAVRSIFSRPLRQRKNLPDEDISTNLHARNSSDESYAYSDWTESTDPEETEQERGSLKLSRWTYKEPGRPTVTKKRRNSSSSVALRRSEVGELASNFRRRSLTVGGMYTKQPGYDEVVAKSRSNTNEPVSINPTQWIRQLFNNGGPKTPEDSSLNLTARPLKHSYVQPTVTPSDSFGPWYDPDSSNAENAASKAQYEKDRQVADAATQFQRRTSEAFNKMILDLEALLSEALGIAKEASERKAPGCVTETLQQVTDQLHDADASEPDRNRGSIAFSPKNLSPTRPVTDPHKASPAQNVSSLFGNGLGSAGSKKLGSSAGPAPVHRIEHGEELPQSHTLGHITIVEPGAVEHANTDQMFIPTADHLLTPYPHSPATTSEGPSARASVQLEGSPETVASHGDPSNTRTSRPKKSSPLARGREHYFEASEADTSSNESNQQTPPRFYKNTKKSSTRPRHTLKKAHSTNGVFRGQFGKTGAVYSTGSRGEDHEGFVYQDTYPMQNLPSRDDVHDYIREHHTPPIQPRHSSSRLRYTTAITEVPSGSRKPFVSGGHIYYDERPFTDAGKPKGSQHRVHQSNESDGKPSRRRPTLKEHRHISLQELRHFSLRRSHRRQPISRNWSTAKKRFTAAVACISTALVGIIVGVYAGEVPAIQYQITDMHHYAILGNVFLYIGLAIPTLVFWPLPLLHGRKPYTLIALALFMPLQFPQGLIVSTQRSPYNAIYRATLLTVRLLSGFALGFANINFKTTLLDLFGASLQSGNPHQERVIENDVRRHGGGMGLWLGIWSWCFIASIGVGFLIGALIINKANPQWGFWLVVFLTAIVLLLNVLTPEVRRSAYRRSVAQVIKGTGEISRRIARGEIKMHVSLTGPKWWWEEVNAGLTLSKGMMKQPGFIVVALYSSWIYGQIVMVVVLLGALTSKYYRFTPQYVGACVSAVPIGALLAVPFQKASLFSRARRYPQRTDSNTFEKQVSWSSHLVRRTFFMISLPFADLAYTLASGRTGTHFMVPTVFAGLIGFLSILAISECNGIIMETFDTSDLHRPTVLASKAPTSDTERSVLRRTNFSSYPRVSSALAIIHTLGFIFAAVATAVGGVVERAIGAQAATGVVAGILLLFTLALVVVLWRWKVVQVVPDSYWLGKTDNENNNAEDDDGDKENKDEEEEDEWEPVVIGNPTGKTRRMSILELGTLSRWSEIRELNKMMAETGLSRWSQVQRSHIRQSLRRK